MRCDANISVMLKDAKEFGTKVEVKNMNSIRNVQRAIEFEITRQIETLESGGSLSQETRAFDALKGITISLRSKEAANDYRYFPEPDLPPLFIGKEQIDAVAKNMPPLPRALFLKYTQELQLSAYDAYNLTDNKAIAMFFEDVIEHTKEYKSAANWVMGEVKSFLNEKGVEIHDFPISPARLAGLITLIQQGKVSNSIAAQRIFPEMLNGEETAEAIAQKLDLIQSSDDGVLNEYIAKVMELNPTEVARYRAGEKQLIGFFMGQLMKVSGGKADPKVSNQMLRKNLDA
jgi:aspartyl-tRNA(Asn)/glutamyl-tRNA(Gln) amidotransferase subunit B